ncbi:glycosyltransferase family 39 protein [Hymenobacter sp. BT507]|uniref:Glycosyltransferase family 39 protein n=1 Tax=Hymenobacter citatus TaxID=2763506 RepID=A0ABR7MNH7_9BACT|nr:glycosyltransferase family 39 protein [Hymenobacter citatus]
MPKRTVPLLFALLKFAVGFLLASPAYDLHRDEYLYLDHGRHLAWGYLEVPPLLAAQAWLTHALGGGYFWVKFWPFLWGALTVYLVCRLAQRLGGGWFAAALAGSCYLATAYTRLNFLFQPNSFEVLAFTACLYWLVAHWQTKQPRYLYYLGVGVGLSLLNKYTTFFFVAALVGALLLTPQRRLLLSRHVWAAAGVALLLWLPNLLWQLRHGIPFLHHMRELHDTQLVHMSAADFWKEQLVMCLPALWVWVPGVVALLLYPPFRPYRAVGLTSVLGLLLLTVLHGKGYYALGYYPVLFSFGAVLWSRWLARLRYHAYVQPVLVALPVLITLPLLPLLYPLYAPAHMQAISARYSSLGVTRWEDGRQHALPQDYADMLGWRELANKTWQAYQALPAATRARTLIKCSNYGQAGAINYYNRHRHMPPAQSFNGSYLFWFPQQLQGYQHLINIDDEPDDLTAYFTRYRRVAEVQNPYARERGTAVMVGSGPTPALLARAKQEHQAALEAWEGAAAR